MMIQGCVCCLKAQILPSSYHRIARSDHPNQYAIWIVFTVCPGFLDFGIQIYTHVCDMELGIKKEKGEERKIPSLCWSLAHYDVFWRKTLWQVNFLCSFLDFEAPEQDYPHISLPALKHLLSSYNHGKAVVQVVRLTSITHIVLSFSLQVHHVFFHHSFDLFFTPKNLV